MAQSNLAWGCCTTGDQNEKYLQCGVCMKAFHHDCLSLEASFEKSSWICPFCALTPSKRLNNDNTPVRFNTNVTVRSNKRQALQSPPGSESSALTEKGIRAIINEAIDAQSNTLLEKITSTMRGLLNKEINSVRTEIEQLKDSVIHMSAQYDDILKEHSEAKQRIRELTDDNIKMSTVIRDMSVRINTLEQNARANNIELQCVPQRKDENLMSLVKHLGKTIDCDINEENVLNCTRVMKFNGNNNRPKSIVVQFNTQRLRDTFLAACINFNKKKNFNDKLNTHHLGLAGEKSPIFVTEHLSPTNKSLHAATRIKAKEMGYKHVWIRGGRIYMRKTDDSEYRIIRDMDSLSKIN
ncbi:uncharacterized protein LOC123662719 [Melitaea cinxia]|uniref:uncharacterized protein LOC123662719 n=1 Tax=Melitaea cinxia TaxID=113334 RepID=UPI001E270B21|nr:uncharacterized protein LOC123662719 [Melitaea cinxia]